MPHEMVRFLLVGFVAGWIANILARGRIRSRGCFPSILIGMLGALGGGYLFHVIGLRGVPAVLSATLGAIVVLMLIRVLRTM